MFHFSPENPPSLSLIPSAVGAACSALDVVPEPPPLPPPEDDSAAELGVGGATVVDTRDARWISNSEGLLRAKRRHQLHAV